MDKFTVFREMLDYMARIIKVTDADMNYCYDRMRIIGEDDDNYICIEVTIKNGEEKKDA